MTRERDWLLVHVSQSNNLHSSWDNPYLLLNSDEFFVQKDSQKFALSTAFLAIRTCSAQEIHSFRLCTNAWIHDRIHVSSAVAEHRRYVFHCSVLLTKHLQLQPPLKFVCAVAEYAQYPYTDWRHHSYSHIDDCAIQNNCIITGPLHVA